MIGNGNEKCLIQNYALLAHVYSCLRMVSSCSPSWVSITFWKISGNNIVIYFVILCLNDYKWYYESELKVRTWVQHSWGRRLLRKLKMYSRRLCNDGVYRFPSLFLVDTFRHFGPQILNSQIKRQFLTMKMLFWTNFVNVNKQICRKKSANNEDRCACMFV